MARTEVVLSPGNHSGQTLETIRTTLETNKGKVYYSIAFGDLTQVDADAILCPANPGFEYAGMGGVQDAMARNSGMETFNEAESKAKDVITNGLGAEHNGLIGVPLGYAAATTAGNLARIKSIIHVNNMRVDQDPPCDENVVRLCITSALSEADRIGMKSVATPALGTGLWGLGMGESLRGIMHGLVDYVDVTPNPKVNKLLTVLYAQPSLNNANTILSLLNGTVLD